MTYKHIATIPDGYAGIFYMNTFVAIPLDGDKPPLRLEGTEWEEITPELEDDLGDVKFNVGRLVVTGAKEAYFSSCGEAGKWGDEE